MIADLARGWLVAINAGIGLPLGALALLNIHALTGGLWGQEARPVLRPIAGLLPLMLVLGLPLLAAIGLLLPFLAADPASLPERVANKLGYLQPSWIVLRTFAGGAAWLVAGFIEGRGRGAAVAGLILYMLGLTVFTTDWGQALDPGYYSTIYPVEVAGAQILGALALATALVPRDAKGDFGKLLLAVILSWSYFAAMQWLISWMGNLPDEAAWYLEHMAGWWGAVLVLTTLLFAVVPFVALLREAVRKDLRQIRPIAWTIVAGYVLDTVWRLAPAFPPEPLIVVGLLLIGGIFWLWLRWQRPTAEPQHV
jgi:hypothetical protein